MPVIRDNLSFSVVVPANSNGSYLLTLNNILPLPTNTQAWIKNILFYTLATPPTSPTPPIIDITCDLVKRSALYGDVALDRVVIGTQTSPTPTGSLYRELMIPIITRNQPSNVWFTFKDVTGKPFNNDQTMYMMLFIVWE